MDVTEALTRKALDDVILRVPFHCSAEEVDDDPIVDESFEFTLFMKFNPKRSDWLTGHNDLTEAGKRDLEAV